MMKKKSLQKVITALASAFLLCGVGVSLLTTAQAEESAGITVYKNYDIEENYADLLLNKNGDLGEYFTSYYSGGAIDFNSGYLYEADAKGTASTVRLIEKYGGEFNVIGQGFYDEFTASSGGFTGDYGRFSLQFTNSDNAKQYFKFSFTQSSYHYLELNAYYYDKEVQDGSLYKKTMNICASFTGKAAHFNNKNVPFKFKYDMDEGMLYIRNTDGAVEHDLTADMFAGGSLPVFENYSVDMLFENKSQTHTAKFLVYELCGQRLAGETPLNTAGARIFAKATKKIVAGFSYQIPTPYAYDILDGDLSSAVTCEAFCNGSESVAVANGAFTASKTAEFYTLVYSVEDWNGEVTENTVIVEVLSAVPAVEILFEGELLSSYPTGSTVQIPSAKVYSGIAYQPTVLPYYTLVQKNGEVLHRIDGTQDREYTAEGLGDYDIVYVFANELGLIGTETKTFEVKDIPRFENTGLPKVFSVNQRTVLPVALLVHGERKQEVTASVFAPDGSEIQLQENAFTPMRVGEYTVRFSATMDGTDYQEEYAVNCAIGASSLIENVSGVVSVEGNADLPAYSSAGNGIKVLADARNSTFKFANPIDLNTLSKDENLIELQVLSGGDYAGYTELIIELVDAENEQNTVKVKYRYNQWNDTYSYVLLNYNGKSLGIRNEVGHQGEVDNYFGLVTHNSFSGHKYQNKVPFAVRVDYAERQFFVRESSNTYKMLLDADDPALVGENIWSGFSSGKVYLQVTMQTLYDVGGVIVTELAGQSLSGALLEDEVAPNSYFEENEYISDFSQMPTGCVNYLYHLPVLTAEDVLSPYCIVERALYFQNGGEWVFLETGEANEFMPTQTGEYRLVYAVSDLYGNYEEIFLYFSVNAERSAQVQFIDQPEEAVAGKRFYIPEIEVLGASGEVVFEYTVYLNDTQVRLSKNRELYLSEAGELKIVYSFSDYLETNQRGMLTISISASDEPLIEINGRVPLTAIQGRTVTLPEFSAKVFSDDGYESANSWIEADGVRLNGNTFEVAKSKGEKIVVKFCAENGGRVAEAVYTITVIEPIYLSDYLVADDYQNLVLTNEKFYTSIVTAGDNRVSLPNAVVGDELTLRFTVDPLHNHFEALRICLTDSVQRDKKLVFTVEPSGETQSKISFGDGRFVLVQASFYSRDKEFCWIVDSKTKTVSDENGNLLFTIEEFDNGDYFDGFTNGVAYLSFEISGVETGKTGSLELIQVSNQIFASTYKSGVLQPYTDKTAPVLFLTQRLYNHTVEYNTQMVIPSAWAHDVLGGEKEIKVTLFAPDGRKVIDDAPCNEDIKVALTEYGYYTIRYITENNAKPYYVEYYVKVRNRNAPQISVEGTLKSSYALGEKLAIPKATVLNNELGNITLYIFLQTPSGRLVNYTEQTEITLTEKGEYQLIFYAVDEEYNLSEKVYTFKVV